MRKASHITEDDMMGEVTDIPEEISGESSEKSPEKLIDYPDRDTLEAQLTETEEKLKNTEEKLLHALADRDNIQKRGEQRVIDAHKYAVSKLLEELIPVLDSLEQSITLEETQDNKLNNMRQGMLLTLQMLLKILEKFGVKEINPVDQEIFNPALHEVMLTQENPDVPPNAIIRVMQKGYELHGRLIRPARVMIAKAPGSP